MKTDHVLNAIGLALAAFTFNVQAQAINLGAASDFSVLAGSGITITGPTTIYGDIGSDPTPSITGLENLTLLGTNHAGDSFTQAAKTSLTAAFLDAAGRTATTSYATPFDLAGSTLFAGVYDEASSFALNGVLTLDAQGDPNAMWIFQAGSTLTTGSGSSILLTGGAQASNVFWQIGSSATLGTNSSFAGNILAQTSISSSTGAATNGKLLAIDGAVTLQSSLVGVPEPATLTLFGMVAGLLMRRRRCLRR